LDAAEAAAAARAIAPHRRTLPIRIERDDDARFLAGDDQIAGAGNPDERRGCAEVEVRPRARTAVHLARRAAERVALARIHLPRPAHRARLQIEGHDRI